VGQERSSRRTFLSLRKVYLCQGKDRDRISDEYATRNQGIREGFRKPIRGDGGAGKRRHFQEKGFWGGAPLKLHSTWSLIFWPPHPICRGDWPACEDGRNYRIRGKRVWALSKREQGDGTSARGRGPESASCEGEGSWNASINSLSAGAQRSKKKERKMG